MLTDLRMPRMDGFALAAAIRANEKGKNRVPIVAISADAMEEARERSVESGIDRFLTKPLFALMTLRRALKRLDTNKQSLTVASLHRATNKIPSRPFQFSFCNKKLLTLCPLQDGLYRQATTYAGYKLFFELEL